MSKFEKLVFFLFFKKSSRFILSLKNKYQNQSVLIVANGPSLNETQLDRLSHLPSIGMNKINLLFDNVNWRPDIIICSNWLVAKQNKEFYKHTAIPSLLSTKCLLGLHVISNAFYFYLNRNIFISNKLEAEFGSGGTVTFVALQLAKYMGASKIYIVGLDHNFSEHTNLKNKPIIKNFEGNDINHFHPNYFRGQKWALPNIEMSEQSYNLFYDTCIKDNIEIYDLTINGKCTIFPKMNIGELYE